MTFSKFEIYFQVISNCHLKMGINFFGTPCIYVCIHILICMSSCTCTWSSDMIFCNYIALQTLWRLKQRIDRHDTSVFMFIHLPASYFEVYNLFSSGIYIRGCKIKCWYNNPARMKMSFKTSFIILYLEHIT